MSRRLALVLLCLSTTVSHAEPRYLDDRSTAESVIKSLYNAVNRKEYARAWDYFSEPPAAKFDDFVNGYKDTASVEVVTGAASADGTAGSVFYEVPVALKSVDGKGAEKFFAGCYTLRLVSPTAQEPPYRWLRIEKGSLKPTESQFLPDALPKSCGDAVLPTAAESLLAEATERFENEQVGKCSKVEDSKNGTLKPEVHELRWKYAGASADDPGSVTTLFVFPCDLAAYNSVEVYYIHDSLDGLRQLSLAKPEVNFVYEGENSAKLKSWQLTGLETTDRLINSGFDKATGMISEWAKWRGVGDASSSASWTFKEGRFSLTDYSVDPTYDEEINPFDIYKNGVPIALKSP
jgi:hypothetical protein